MLKINTSIFQTILNPKPINKDEKLAQTASFLAGRRKIARATPPTGFRSRSSASYYGTLNHRF